MEDIHVSRVTISGTAGFTIIGVDGMPMQIRRCVPRSDRPGMSRQLQIVNPEHLALAAQEIACGAIEVAHIRAYLSARLGRTAEVLDLQALAAPAGRSHDQPQLKIYGFCKQVKQ